MQKLHPSSVWLFFISTFLRIIFYIPVLSFIILPLVFSESEFNFLRENLSLVIILLILVNIIISFIWAKVSYSQFLYTLSDMGFQKESGVIFKKYVTIPYNRIQNVDIDRDPVSRLLGLSNLKIQTAGSSTAYATEGKLPGLSREDAELVRGELISRAKKGEGI